MPRIEEVRDEDDDDDPSRRGATIKSDVSIVTSTTTTTEMALTRTSARSDCRITSGGGVPLSDVRNFCIIAHVVRDENRRGQLFALVSFYPPSSLARISSPRVSSPAVRGEGRITESRASRILEYTGNLGKEKQSTVHELAISDSFACQGPVLNDEWQWWWRQPTCPPL